MSILGHASLFIVAGFVGGISQVLLESSIISILVVWAVYMYLFEFYIEEDKHVHHTDYDDSGDIDTRK